MSPFLRVQTLFLLPLTKISLLSLIQKLGELSKNLASFGDECATRSNKLNVIFCNDVATLLSLASPQSPSRSPLLSETVVSKRCMRKLLCVRVIKERAVGEGVRGGGVGGGGAECQGS